MGIGLSSPALDGWVWSSNPWTCGLLHLELGPSGEGGPALHAWRCEVDRYVIAEVRVRGE